MATEWDAFPVASSRPSVASEWDAFPVAEAAPVAEKPLGLEYAPLDVGLALGTGTAASVYGGLKGLGTLVSGGGLDQAAQDVQQATQDYTWQPRGRAGQAVVQTIGDVMHGVTNGVGKVTGGIGEIVGGESGRDIGELVADIGVPGALTLAGYKPAVRGANFAADVGKAMFDQAKAAKAAKTASSTIERIQAEPGKMQALQQAKDLPYPLAVEPLTAKNTIGNKLLTSASDEPVLRAKIAKENKPLWAENAKAQMGIDQNKVLTPQVYDEYRASISGPKNQITALQYITPDENVIVSLDKLRADYALLGKEPAAASVNRLIDNAQQQIAYGMSGKQIMDNIESLRQSARRTLGKKEVPAAEMDIADAQIAVSKALEDAIESHLSKAGATDILSAYKDMRKKMAISYAYESATDMNSNLIRPDLLAKATQRESLADGPIAAMGRIAGTMPEIVAAEGAPISWQHLLRRSSVPGTLGAIAGGAIAGPAGAIIGGATSAGLSQWLAGPLARRRALSQSVQRGLRPDVASLESPVPLDVRAPSTPIPWEAPIKGAAGSRIGFADEPTGIDFNAFAQDYRTRKAMESKSPETFISREQAADWFRKERQERSARAAAEANRQPASGGMPYDLDPLTNTLRPADQGLKGATPSTVSSTGNNLSSAVDKISSGRNFALSAEEKLAWNKSKVDLAEAAPELRGLSDDAVASRIADRQWVDNRIRELKSEYANWAKESADRFNAERAGKINERANNPPVLSAAERATRKQMNAEASRRMQLSIDKRKADMQAKIDALESMSDQMTGRSTSGGIYLGQGPKTRQALRDLLQQ